MNFVIQLPPEPEREEMIDRWVEAMLTDDSDFRDFHEVVGRLTNSGYSQHGITCFFLHDTTHKYIKNKIVLRRHSEWMDAALAHPIGLN